MRGLGPLGMTPIRIMLLGAFLVLAGEVQACGTCRPAVEAAVYDSHFIRNLASLLLPLALIGGVAYSVGRREE